MRDDTPLLGLKNIGRTIAARLKAVGVETVGDLRAIGPAKAYKRVKAENPEMTVPVCYYLYSLQGALDGLHWDALRCLRFATARTAAEPGRYTA